MIPSVDIPLLLGPGDCMELEEFLERWEREPRLKFAELIDGVVYMPSPLSLLHSDFDGLADLVLAYYAARSGICKNLLNPTWLMLTSAPQPDLALSLKPEYGGRIQVTPGELASGLPELVV